MFVRERRLRVSENGDSHFLHCLLLGFFVACGGALFSFHLHRLIVCAENQANLVESDTRCEFFFVQQDLLSLTSELLWRRRRR